MLQHEVCELSGTESLKHFSCYQLTPLHSTPVAILDLCGRVGGWEVRVGWGWDGGGGESEGCRAGGEK